MLKTTLKRSITQTGPNILAHPPTRTRPSIKINNTTDKKLKYHDFLKIYRWRNVL